MNQAKCKINSRVVLGERTPAAEEVVRRLARVDRKRRKYRSVKDDLDAVEAITLGDIMRVLGQYPLTKAMSMAVGPLETLPSA